MSLLERSVIHAIVLRKCDWYGCSGKIADENIQPCRNVRSFLANTKIIIFPLKFGRSTGA
ncbi:hypothetical protein EGCR1_00525 [Enterococcus gilvus]|nr:hypothetical protein EGCR1_00525 [Enterococcus gilvus]